MKILYLRLLNSAGIFAGTGKTSIEIDFSKSDKRLIMLFGGNGSGKTTILSALNPYNNSVNDDRISFFIPETNAEKEIHYLLDDTVYLIRHYLSAKNKTKSYISQISKDEYFHQIKNKVKQSAIKNTEELNDNGNVTSFKELIEEIFNINEDFFKISRIGSNVTNFIDLSTANRKKYISTFLPDIDEYLNAYEVVNTKYRNMKKEIDFIADEINKIGDAKALEDRETVLEQLLKSNQENLTYYTEKISEAKTQLRNLDTTGKLEENKFVNYLKYEYNLQKEDYEQYKSLYSDNIDKKIIDLKVENSRLNEKSVNNKNLISKNLGEINFKTSKIANIIDLDSLKINRSNLENKVTDLKDKLDRFDTKNSIDLLVSPDSFQSNDIKYINNIFNTYIEKLSRINTVLSGLNNPEKLKNEIKNFILNKSFDFTNLNNQQINIKNTINGKRAELEELIKKQSNLTNNFDQLEILKKRPENCKDDNCPFIKNALKYKNLEKDLQEVTDEIDSIRTEINSLNDEQEKLSSFINELKAIINYLSELTDTLRQFKIFNELDEDSFYFNSLNYIENNFIKIKQQVSNILQYYSTYFEYKIQNKQLEDTDKIIKENEKINQETELIKAEISVLIEENNNLNKENSSILNLVKENTDLISQYSLTESVVEGFLKIEKEYNEIETALKSMQQYKKDFIEYTDLKNNINTNIENYTNENNQIKAKIINLQNYNTRKTNLEENYTTLSLVKEALNPTKGIPIIFIQNYLNTTKSITNNLLNISQKKDLAVNFEITERDFFIRVYKNNGDILEDINQASQGEIALISLSLSLALIEQSVTKYNILLLDELDGALDVNNRRSFIDMLTTQIDILDAEQTFIISHNNEFETASIGMILLDTHNINTNDKKFISNKEIIFSV